MRINASEFVPVAFWVGFLMLGLFTSVGQHGGAQPKKHASAPVTATESLDKSAQPIRATLAKKD